MGTRNQISGTSQAGCPSTREPEPQICSSAQHFWEVEFTQLQKHGEQDAKVDGERLLLVFHYSRILLSTTKKPQLPPHLPAWKQILQLLLFAKCAVCCLSQQHWDERTDVSKQNDQKVTEMAWSEWKVPFSPFSPCCCGLGLLRAPYVLEEAGDQFAVNSLGWDPDAAAIGT